MTLVHQLGPGDVALLREMLAVFGEAFDDERTYRPSRPRTEYLRRMLASESFIALAARVDDTTVGALAAYELPKFEQERSEIYIYDLAVRAAYRRRRIATALIQALQRIAAERRTHVIFVQADYVDDAAVALYTKLGVREEVLHFDIPVVRPGRGG